MFSKTFENASKIFKGFKTCQPKKEIFHFGGDATIFFCLTKQNIKLVTERRKLRLWIHLRLW